MNKSLNFFTPFNNPLAPMSAGIFISLLIGAMFLFIASFLLTWLWNITITKIFSIREITFWEAFRLIIICSILFN